MKTTRLLILSILATTLTGCFKKNKWFAPNNQQHIIDASSELPSKNSSVEPQIKVKNKDLVNQAKQQSLAIPVGYKLKGYSELIGNTKHSELFIYDGSLRMAQIIKFYKKELELNGWIYADLSTKKEGLLVSDKSSKKCVISIRPFKGNASTIHIFVQDKASNADANNFVNLNGINKGIQSW